MTSGIREQLQATLGSAYTIERELGGGGMSRVFVATETSLGREVVVKILPTEMAGQISVDRFRREIALAARLQHPHIVPLLTAGEADGLPYFTMPFVKGESLRARLVKEGELPVSDAVRVLREVAAALAFAHDAGVVHRDIKPDNVLMAGGSAMVTDFGVAKALSASTTAGGNALTSLGVALGTPAYMAPEQASADPLVDHRADIYAWGVLAYELLTGSTPFGGRTPQGVLAAHLTETPELVSKRRPSITSPLAMLVMRCLEKRASDRPQTAREIVLALDSIHTPSGGSEPTSTVGPAPLGATRIPAARRAAVATVAVVLIAAAVFGWRAFRGRGAAAAAMAPQRVVVATFQNRTGDASLDPLGVMAADWIARGLAGTGIVDVAGTAAELSARSGLTVGTTTAAIEQLGRDAKAEIVISGALYRQGDSLLVQADFTDVTRGRLIESVGPVTTTPASALDGIERLRQRVTGALAPLIDSTLSGAAQQISRPPSYEAYREFLRGEALFYTDEAAAADALLRTSALDTTYVYPLLRAASVLNNAGRFREADSVVRIAERRRRLLSPYESAYLDATASTVRGDEKRALDAATRMVAAAPNSEYARYYLAHSLYATGRARQCLDVLQHLDPQSGALRGRVYYYLYFTTCSHDVGDFRQELEIARQGERQYPGRLLVMGYAALALAAQGRTSELATLVDSMNALPNESGIARSSHLATIAEAIYEARAHDHPETAVRLESMLRAMLLLRSQGRTSPDVRGAALAFAAVGAWKDLATVCDAPVRHGTEDPEIVSRCGLAAAKLGDTLGVRAAERRLDELGQLPYGGRDHLIAAQALVAAATGDRARAVSLLRSRSTGGTTGRSWHQRPIFALLRDYPPFQELIKPRE